MSQQPNPQSLTKEEDLRYNLAVIRGMKLMDRDTAEGAGGLVEDTARKF
jgi:hypothetical protein